MMQSIQNDSAGVGERLAHAREAAGLSHADVSAKLHMPVHIVQALEREDFAALGAPVFVRGRLRSYARLLALQMDGEIERAQASTPAPAALVSHTHTPRAHRVFEQMTRRAAYIAITAAILVPVWLATKPHLSGTMPIDTLDPVETSIGARPAASTQELTPVVASMTTLPAAAPAPAIALQFDGESWLEAMAPDGRFVDRALMSAGDRRSYASGEVARIKFGNANAVRVLNQGKAVDLTAFSAENVARFAVSSDGSVAPLND